MTAKLKRVHMPNIGEALCRQGSGTPYAAAYDACPAGFNIGDFIRMGSKTFALSYTGGAITSVGLGCKNGLPQGVANSALAANAAAGATSVDVTTSATSGAAGTGLMLLNEFAGGEIVLFTSGSDIPQRRGITGNTARVATGNVTVTFYLDSPLTTAMTTANGTAECMHSPWAYVVQDTQIGHPVVGVPMVVATAAQWMWLQTWGPTFVSPQAACGIAGATGLYWRHDGSLDVENADAFVSDQYAGFVLAETSTHTQAAPFVMIQICP